MSTLEQQLDDPLFPLITYRRGGSGIPRPVIRGTAIHVQTIAILHNDWQMTREKIADEYDLSARQVEEALLFYEAHRDEIEACIAFEEQLTTMSQCSIQLLDWHPPLAEPTDTT